MKIKLHHHWNNQPLWVWKKSPEGLRTFEKGQAQKTFEESFLKDLKIPKDNKALKGFIDNDLNSKFGPDAYINALQKIVQNHIKNNEYRNGILKEARKRYTDRFNQLKQILFQRLEKKLNSYRETQDGIRKLTQNQLGILSQGIQKGNQTDQIREKIKASTSINESQVQNLAQALHNQHFNESLAQKENLSSKQIQAYQKAKNGFRYGVEFYIREQSKEINKKFPESKSKERVEAFRKLIQKIENTYQNISGADGIVHFKDLGRILSPIKTQAELLDEIRIAKSNEALIKNLEKVQWLNPEALQRAGQEILKSMKKEVYQNHAEGLLQKWAQKKLNSKSLPSVNQAINLMREYISKQIRLGAKEGVKAINEVDQLINVPRADIIRLPNIRLVGMRTMATRERYRLLKGELIPKNPHDVLVVQFMRLNPNQQIQHLKNKEQRKKLFRAIKTILKHYPKTYSKEFKRGLPKKSNLLRYSTDLSRPNSHDKTARLLALITLAKESKLVIQNLDQKTEFKKENLNTELEKSKIDKISPKIDLRFINPKDKFRVEHVASGIRAGFNLKNIALTTAQVWLGVTVIMNYMNFRKEHGWTKGAARLIQNPFFLAAAGGLYGIHKYKQNPAFQNYLKETAGGQERTMVHASLNSLAKKFGSNGKERINRIRNNPNEWKLIHALMQKPKSGAKKINKLLAGVRKKASKMGKKPTLGKEDLKKLIIQTTGSERLYHLLPNNGDDRMRYRIYSQFLTSPRNTHDLEEHFKRWPNKLVR